ncbi:MAG: ATP-dependent zinc metalloprotease FtsH [Thermodesulfovibrionales bacterium]|nr:ATP-dependent zinc metalloprotease FtsH [Thermodesulfovibrionales bacterium]
MSEEKPTIADKMKNPQWRVIIAAFVLLLFFYLWGQFYATGRSDLHTISYSQFLQQLQDGNVQSVLIRELQVSGEFTKEIFLHLPGEKAPVSAKKFQTFLPSFQGEGLLAQLREKNVAISVEPSERGSFLWQLLIGVLPWVLIIGVWILIMKRAQQIQGGAGGLFTFGASKAKLFDAKKIDITFKDVAGMENVKKELMETVEFLKDPARFKKLGAKIPKGVLLVGPPGTGKTLLARATAGEAGVPFYSISASEFIEMFVGVGASRVRDMFKKAKESQPSIIFIDEIDAVGRTRGAGFGGGHDEREQTLNQLLSEMDGFESHEEVIVLAATNRPDVLDPALLRPGRFDRHIVIDRPGLKERKAILEVHTRGKIVAEGLDFEKIARGTPGMTGADLENIANEAALIAVRKGKEKIEMSDFEEARDVSLMGAVREETISESEKRITAYHEAGHALVAWNLPGTDPIHKVSIIPRGMAMGVTQLLPQEDRHYYPKKYLMNRLSVGLAGRVAEQIVFNDMSSGAQNDLKEATALAEKMVAQWGMSDKVGPVNLGRGEEHPFLGRELAQPKRYSEEMAWLMDQEIRELIIDAEKKAQEILSQERNVLDALANALIKEEVLEKTAIEKIIQESKNS